LSKDEVPNSETKSWSWWNTTTTSYWNY
jgi:hypothetical protein